MARPDTTDLARIAREFVEQQRQLGDTELWPKPDPNRVARIRAESTREDAEESETHRPRIARSSEPVQPAHSPVKKPPVVIPMKTPTPQNADTSQPLDPGEWEGLTLDQFEAAIAGCKRCRLHENALNFVFGKGNPNADIMFIGEAPGQDEDRQGVPFVGRAGQLLDKMIVAMKLDPGDVYIGNICKHRPPNNRNPQPDEVEACLPYLIHQIEFVKPKCLCLLGRVAAQALLGSNDSLGRMREKWFEYRGTKVLVTYHPAALLRNPGWKKHAWEDLKRLRKAYDGVIL
ncbi:MAG TPA: uracil-DNA glycosylase [Firmicutes bacterium]|nr:uracil-DNA glycosylase [Bacillota bacterium]